MGFFGLPPIVCPVSFSLMTLKTFIIRDILIAGIKQMQTEPSLVNEIPERSLCVAFALPVTSFTQFRQEKVINHGLSIDCNIISGSIFEEI